MGVEAGRLALAGARARLGRAHRRPVVLHGRPGLRRQDQRHDRARRPAGVARVAGLRRQRRRALRRRRAAGHARRHRHAPRGERRPPQRPGRRPRRGRRSATAPPRWSWATAADGAPVLAEVIGKGGATEEFLDRWRAPGQVRSKVWEERFGETRYVPLGQAAWDDALKHAGLVADQVDRVIVTGTHGRANAALAKKLGLGDRLVDDLAATVGQHRRRPPRAAAHRRARGGRARARSSRWSRWPTAPTSSSSASPTPSPRGRRPDRSPARPRAGAPIDYGTYLRWRGLLPVEPPRRPEPARPSASASARSSDWKFGFVGSADDAGEVHLPPQPARRHRGAHGRRHRHDRHLHDRPPRLLAEPAGGLRGGRLRRRRPPARGAHRRRRRPGAHRRPRGADLPQALHRRRHPQLLLEGRLV